MKKYEWRKNDKDMYLPKKNPVLLSVQTFNYYTIEGQGNPNSEEFSKRIEVLYQLSYGIRMIHKTEFKPNNYYDYTVFPLEGIWDLVDPSIGFSSDNKENLKYKIMIRQPDFVDTKLAKENLERIKTKKNNPLFDSVQFESIVEGDVVQIMHEGPYDNEPESFAKIDTYLKLHELQRKSLIHKEIYISDARKTAPEKLKTVLRVYVEKIQS